MKEKNRANETGSGFEDLIMILETKNLIYVNMVKGALDNEGIPALLKSPMGHYLRGMMPIDQGFFNLKLYVRKKDEEKAAEIVRTIVPPEEIT